MRNVSCLVSMLAVAGLVTATACAPSDNTTSAPSSAPAADKCAKDSLTTLTKGSLTFGTDQPAYPPWFIDDDPANGKGFESAVAYAVADKLGYATEEVKWVRVPFNDVLPEGGCGRRVHDLIVP